MIPKFPTDPALRDQRKADLLMASSLARGQAQLAVDDLGQRADAVVVRARAWRDLVTNPIVLTVFSGGAALFAASGPKRRGKLWRGLRWAWLTWKVMQKR
jgi:hypothetical protein